VLDETAPLIYYFFGPPSYSFGAAFLRKNYTMPVRLFLKTPLLQEGQAFCSKKFGGTMRLDPQCLHSLPSLLSSISQIFRQQ
jgi:hypothetical protein